MAAEQIHLEADEVSKKIETIWKELQEDNFNESHQAEIAQSIRFFGKNLKKLPECNEAMLKVGKCFVMLMNLEVQWSLRDSHAFLLMITSLLLMRRDESVVRLSAQIIKEFVKRLPGKYLKQLANIHAKPLVMIFHKVSKVSTYYSQYKIIDALNTILKAREDSGANILRKEKVLAQSSTEIVEQSVSHFDEIDSNDFLNTSRTFLDHYNSKLFPVPFIHAFNGFLLGVDQRDLGQIEDISVDFNLRNLSVSFFMRCCRIANTKPQFVDEMWFVELEDCEIEAVQTKFKDKTLIELLLKPSRHQIMNEKDDKADYEIESIKIALKDTDNVLIQTVYPMFKDKTPMYDDNMTDAASLMSFCTVNTSICNGNTFAPKPRPVEPLVSNASPDMFDSMETENTLLKPSAEPEKIRKTAKVEPSVYTQRYSRQDHNRHSQVDSHVNFDEPPSDEADLPSASKYLTKKRNERQQNMSQEKNTEESVLPDNSEDFEWKPNAVSTAKKSAKKKEVKPKNSRKPRGITKKADEDDIEDEILNHFSEALKPNRLQPLKRKQESVKKPPVKKVLKKVELNFDEDMDEPAKKNKRQQKSRAKKVPSLKPFSEQNIKIVDLSSKIDVPHSANENCSRPKLGFDPVVEARRKALRNSAAVLKPLKRHANDENLPPAKKSKIDNFDDLLREKNTTILKTALLNCPNLKRISKKRVSFDEKIQIMPQGEDPNATQLIEDIEEEIAQNQKASLKTKAFQFDEILVAEKKSDLQQPQAQKQQQKPVASVEKMQQKHQPSNLRVNSDRNIQIGYVQGSKLRPKPQIRDLQIDLTENIPKKSVSKSNLPIQEKEQMRPVTDFQTQVLKACESRFNHQRPQLTVQKAHNERFKQSVQLEPKAISKPEFKKPVPIQTPQERSTKQCREPAIVFDMNTLQENQLLEKFIDQISNFSPNDDMEEDENMNEMTVTTSQTVQTKKMSPTTIRTVQIQEISISPNEKKVSKEDYKELLEIVERKSKKFYEPLLSKMQKVMESDCPLSKELKEKGIKSLAKARESKERFQMHLQEHQKLLKRLHHSKMKLKQFEEQQKKSFTAFAHIQKQLSEHNRKVIKTKLKRILAFKKLAEDAEHEIKKEAWHEYMHSITSHIRNILQSHYDF